MITMEILARFDGCICATKVSLHDITKRTGLSRNTIRKWLGTASAAPPTYRRETDSDVHDPLEWQDIDCLASFQRADLCAPQIQRLTPFLQVVVLVIYGHEPTE